MNECPWWELVSAAADDELAERDRATAEAHASVCAACTASLDATASLRRPRRPVLSTAPTSARGTEVLAGRSTTREQRWLTGRWARRLLALTAILIVLGAVPAYVRGQGLSVDSHAARHLAAWHIGFGTGLFVAAWVSRMSHAMLALAATFATLTVVATVIDIAAGHSGPLAEPVHLVELVAVFLLWRLTPPHLLPWHRTASSTTVASGDATSPTLTLVQPDTREQDEPTR